MNEVKIIEGSPVCDPIDKLLTQLDLMGVNYFNAILEDYHFKQLHFKFKQDIKIVENFDLSEFIIKENKLICKCHWSVLEFE
jgi:hypothetical protein